MNEFEERRKEVYLCGDWFEERISGRVCRPLLKIFNFGQQKNPQLNP